MFGLSKEFYRRSMYVCFLLTLLFLSVGCTTAWTTEAVNIIRLLGPALTSFLGILSAFGVGLSPATLTDINAYEQQAQHALEEVASLVQEYEAASAGTKDDYLKDIDVALSVVKDNMSKILPLINIKDVNTQKDVAIVFDAIVNEVNALVAVIPALQNPNTQLHHMREIVKNVKGAHDFKHDFNTVAGRFGETYKLK